MNDYELQGTFSCNLWSALDHVISTPGQCVIAHPDGSEEQSKEACAVSSVACAAYAEFCMLGLLGQSFKFMEFTIQMMFLVELNYDNMRLCSDL